MPLSDTQKYIVLKALRKYFGEQLIMIKNFIDFARAVNTPTTKVVMYAAAMCDIRERMRNWVLKYAREMFGIELSFDEADALASEAMLQMGTPPGSEDIFNICLNYRTSHGAKVLELIKELLGRK